MKAKNFLYGRKGPWPQPCPDHPYDESPGVIHLPINEWIDWWLRIGSRFVFLWPALTPIYFLDGLLNPGCKKVSDEEFHNYLTNTMMARFITPNMDEVDCEVFNAHMKPGKKYFVVDLDPVRVIKPFKGMHVSPTKTLLEEIAPQVFKIECIWMNKTAQVIEPTDGMPGNWQNISYFRAGPFVRLWSCIHSSIFLLIASMPSRKLHFRKITHFLNFYMHTCVSLYPLKTQF